LLTVDLDRFKEINDTLGHTIGDQLLAAVAARLDACAPTSTLVARLGGDEFCLLVRPTKQLPNIDALASRILAEMHRPFLVEGNVLNVGASIGMAMAPQDAETPIDLLKCSDLALYQAKAKARGSAIWYTSQMHDALTKRRALEEELRNALAAGELVVFYQPIVDSRTATVVCMEALLRWRHPQRGLVSPAEFIPIAEETGLIVDIGVWALRQACKDALSWPESVRVSVNLAPRQFQQTGLVESVAQILNETGLTPDRLELEITETTLMMQTDDVEGKVRAICNLGVRLSLDDFGTGYSSLGYLDRFPVKKVKIDRAFAKQALESPKTQAIVGAISLLARDLGIDLVAEGVETHAQLAFMASRSIFLIQGYLYSKPLPIEELAARLNSWSDAPRLESAA
jgi:diguanylate cyclase (GGDEF)-like protein